jgi:hypothetical protein
LPSKRSGILNRQQFFDDLEGTVTTNFDGVGGGWFIWTVDGVSTGCCFTTTGSITHAHSGPDIYANIEGGGVHKDRLYVAWSTNDTVVNLKFDYPAGVGPCGHTHDWAPISVTYADTGGVHLHVIAFSVTAETNAPLRISHVIPVMALAWIMCL